MKKISKLFKKEYIVIATLVIISLFPLYFPGFLYTHDGIIHLYRTAGAYENIINLDFFNRISYNMINGYGYGWGIFYPPLSAIVPAVFMCFGLSLFTAEKLFLVLFSILAGIFSYKLFNEIFKNNLVSLICSILYVLAPYKIEQIIIRGAMGEVALFTFLPLVIFGLIKIINKEYKYKYYLILGTLGIVYSHTISTVYTAIFALIFVILNIKKVFNKKTIIELLKSFFIVLLISLPIFIPMLQHKNLDIYKISETTVDVSDRVVHPGQLIGGSFESKEVENTSYLSNEKEMNYMIGLTTISILSLFPFFYKKLKEKGELIKFIKWAILLLISILMMIIPFIWDKVEILDVIQYPWRLLNFSVLFIAILAGYIIKEIIKTDNKFLLLLMVIFYSMLFVLFIGSKAKFAKTLNQDFNFYEQEVTEKDDYGSFAFSLGYAHEYLPKVTNVNTIKSEKNEIKVIKGKADIEKFIIDDNVIYAEIETLDEQVSIEVPRIYYKGYSILVDGKNNNYYIGDNGFINLDINSIGKHSIVIKYTGTTLYIIIDYIAIIVFISYISYILFFDFIKIKLSSKKNNKNNFFIGGNL